MDPERSVWTEDAVRAFARGAQLFARDEAANPVPLPPTLLAEGDGLRREPVWSQQVARVHPDDLPVVIHGWWTALHEPHAVHRRRIRSSAADGWHHVELRFLNLLDEPAYGVVLVAIADLGPGDEGPPRPPAAREHAPAAWVLQELDPIGRIIRTDGMVAELFGRDPGALAGRSVLEFLHPDDHGTVIAMWLELLREPGATRSVRVRVLRPDGTDLWIESTVMHRLDEQGVQRVLSVSHDITEERARDAALAESQAEFRLLAEEVPTAVFRTTADGQVTFANHRWNQLVDPDGVVTYLRDAVADGDRDGLDRAWEALVSGGGDGTMLIEAARADRERHLAIRARAVRDPEGRTSAVIGAVEDVTLTAQLRRQVDRDGLTGLLNRSALHRILTDRLAGDDEHLVVLFCDLDGFKQVNDTAGHDVGDLVLAQVARRLDAAVRPGDLLARNGGDEFVLVCHDVPPGEEDPLVDRLRRALEPPVRWNGGTWEVAVSIGVVRRRAGDDVATLLRRADRAMYEAKRRRKEALR